ncbi:hypothetical protein MPC4_60029 [Methylocella tundrae]|uniref:Uncharacterized protein n=1 Tax=Methylocella tundrae TaxID=227605 RepID=A0A8B6MAF6_METTU|nr:hypothetical protein MPC4_60029 [Methylocella tundrae]
MALVTPNRTARTQSLNGSFEQSPESVWPKKQIAEGLAHAKRKPAPAAMLVPVMQHVATLAERLQVAQTIICRVMVEMRGRQIDMGASPDSPLARRSDNPG